MSVVDAVRIEERDSPSVVSIAARRGVDADRIGAAIGVPMPADRAWITDGAVVMMAIGPGMWLSHDAEAPTEWSRDLEQRLAGLASVSDQTGAYRLFRIEGLEARTLLQRGVAIDLHDAAFPAGSVAVTVLAHIDVVMRCLEPGKLYEAAVYRSYAESFLRWIGAGLGELAS